MMFMPCRKQEDNGHHRYFQSVLQGGIRIVLELKKQTDVDNLLALLYKKTRLEDTFSVNMLAIATDVRRRLVSRALLNISLIFSMT